MSSEKHSPLPHIYVLVGSENHSPLPYLREKRIGNVEAAPLGVIAPPTLPDVLRFGLLRGRHVLGAIPLIVEEAPIHVLRAPRTPCDVLVGAEGV